MSLPSQKSYVCFILVQKGQQYKKAFKTCISSKALLFGKKGQTTIIKQSLYVVQNYTKMNAKTVCCLNPSRVLHATTCHYSILASVSCFWNLQKPINVIESETAPQEISPLKSFLPWLSHEFSPQSSSYPSGWLQDGNWLNKLFSYYWSDQCSEEDLILVSIFPCSRMKMIVAAWMEPDKPTEREKYSWTCLSSIQTRKTNNFIS